MADRIASSLDVIVWCMGVEGAYGDGAWSTTATVATNGHLTQLEALHACRCLERLRLVEARRERPRLTWRLTDLGTEAARRMGAIKRG